MLALYVSSNHEYVEFLHFNGVGVVSGRRDGCPWARQNICRTDGYFLYNRMLGRSPAISVLTEAGSPNCVFFEPRPNQTVNQALPMFILVAGLDNHNYWNGNLLANFWNVSEQIVGKEEILAWLIFELNLQFALLAKRAKLSQASRIKKGGEKH